MDKETLEAARAAMAPLAGRIKSAASSGEGLELSADEVLGAGLLLERASLIIQSEAERTERERKEWAEYSEGMAYN